MFIGRHGNMKIRYLDLFSGIGGFALGLKIAGFEFDKHYYAEVDKYGQKLYDVRFPNAIGLGDVRGITKEKVGTIDVLTGGFPCQPFSVAGKRRGTTDNRYLWPEMLRIIREIRPTWIIGENVAGIINMALDEVLSSLEAEAYEVETFIIPACGVGAPHKRDRVWILAYSGDAYAHNTENGCQQQRSFIDSNGQRKRTGSEEIQGENGEISEWHDDAESGYTNQRYVAGRECPFRGEFCTEGECEECRKEWPDVADTNFTGQQDRRKQRQGQRASQKTRTRSSSGQGELYKGWSEDWRRVAARLCRVDDGLPVELDKFKLSKRGHRIARLKGLGNAVVPQVVGAIALCIKQIMLKED